MNVSRILVKWRTPLFILTTVLAVVCASFIPRLNIIMEVAYFLPDDSPVKVGLEKVQKDFSDLDLMNNMVYVMFDDLEQEDSVRAVLSEVTGGLAPVSVKHKDNHTLFEYMPTKRADIYVCRDAIVSHFGDAATVELGLEKNMPANIVPMLVLGTVIVFTILLLMCASFMEVLLFLICTVLSVALNMGSNILLPSVSFMTNTMVAVLQMVLSMDYSIILMNRYRQERGVNPDKISAMEAAIRGASPSVLSSALTTIVSLMMLVFMRLKIGADLGIVLGKGVFFSLMCNFTVLPALTVWFDKSIFATSKKQFLTLPAGTLARFEMKFRIPLAVIFVALFVVAFIFQQRTPINYAAIWDTPIGKIFPPDNPVILLYDNEDDVVVPDILDTLAQDPNVLSCLSYPGLMSRGYTAEEMAQRFSSLSPLITEDMLRIVYYAYANPERTEKFSLDEIEAVADDLARQGMIPEGLDSRSLMKKLAPPAPVQPAPPAVIAVPDTVSVKPAADSTSMASALADTVARIAPAPEPSRSRYTFELAVRQLPADSMAVLFGVDRSIARTAYRMAGRSRKPGTMSPYELSTFLVTKVLKDKRYASLVSQEQKDQIMDVHRQLDSAFLAGPTLLPERDDSPAPEENTGTDTVIKQTDSPAASVMTADAGDVPAEPGHATAQKPQSAASSYKDEGPTPLERLAQMSFSGAKYSAGTVASALRAAGIKVSRTDMDLLYLYEGSRRYYDPELRMSVGELIEYLDGTLLKDPAFSRFIDDDSAEMVAEVREDMLQGVASLHSENSSLALVTTDYVFESDSTFAFVERFEDLTEKSLSGPYYLIGESVMYKEFKDGFPSEKLLLTILTIAAIFIIVLLTFKSLVVPFMLVMAVMSGVYVNVIVSGLVSNTMYFLGYIIVQSILMGATIDYSILFTSFYRSSRKEHGIQKSLKLAYANSGHSIMTSGLILTIGPYAMSFMITDRMIAMILRPMSIGALASILIIIFILPGMIALADRFTAPKGSVKPTRKD